MYTIFNTPDNNIFSHVIHAYICVIAEVPIHFCVKLQTLTNNYMEFMWDRTNMCSKRVGTTVFQKQYSYLYIIKIIVFI